MRIAQLIETIRVECATGYEMMVAALQRSDDGDAESLQEAKQLLKDCQTKLKGLKDKIDQYKACCVYRLGSSHF